MCKPISWIVEMTWLALTLSDGSNCIIDKWHFILRRLDVWTSNIGSVVTDSIYLLNAEIGSRKCFAIDSYA